VIRELFHRAGRNNPEAAPVSRRGFLTFSAWAMAATFLPRTAAAAQRAASRVRRISFHNLHTDERLTAVYWEGGAYVPSALDEIDAVLRDHRTGEIRPMAPGLIDLVYGLAARLGRLTIVARAVPEDKLRLVDVADASLVDRAIPRAFHSRAPPRG